MHELSLLLLDWEQWRSWFGPEQIRAAVRIAILLGLGIPLVLLLSAVAGRETRRRFSAQSGMLVRKGIYYLGAVVILVTVLKECGFEIGALLGAAGILAVAIGFAAQTSLSNIISGLFLVSEKPFEVGSLIKIGDVMGFVLSIDLLSVKIRTFDNRYVRIPNETLIKTEVTNVTRFPIRRVDIEVGVAYKEDPTRVAEILRELARTNPLCLDEPESLVLFKGFGDSALLFLFGVWCINEDFLALRNSITYEIKQRFDDEGIEIPFPHRTLYTGAVTDAMPIRVVGGAEGSVPD